MEASIGGTTVNGGCQSKLVTISGLYFIPIKKKKKHTYNMGEADMKSILFLMDPHNFVKQTLCCSEHQCSVS